MQLSARVVAISEAVTNRMLLFSNRLGCIGLLLVSVAVALVLLAVPEVTHPVGGPPGASTDSHSARSEQHE